MTTNDISSNSEDRVRTLSQWLTSRKNLSFAESVAEMRVIQETFFAECAARLRKPLNDHLATAMPHNLHSEKVSLVRFVNQTLSSLHLGVRSKTGEVGVLTTDHAKNPEKGQFRLLIGSGMVGRRTAMCSVDLPELDIGHRPIPSRSRFR